MTYAFRHIHWVPVGGISRLAEGGGSNICQTWLAKQEPLGLNTTSLWDDACVNQSLDNHKMGHSYKEKHAIFTDSASWPIQSININVRLCVVGCPLLVEESITTIENLRTPFSFKNHFDDFCVLQTLYLFFLFLWTSLLCIVVVRIFLACIIIETYFHWIGPKADSV